MNPDPGKEQAASTEAADAKAGRQLIIDLAALEEEAAERSRQIDAAQARWFTIVREIIAKAKKIKQEDVKLPEEQRGKYIALAHDSHGNLSVPKPRGRRHPHWRGQANALKSLTLDIFKRDFTEALYIEMHDAAEQGRPPVNELGPQQSIPLYMNAIKEAKMTLDGDAKTSRRYARLRSKLSRRVNAGLVSAQNDRRAVAAGSKTWADIRKITQRKYNAAPKPKPAPAVVDGGAQPAA